MMLFTVSNQGQFVRPVYKYPFECKEGTLHFFPIIFLKLYNPVSYRPNQSNDVKKPTPTAQFKVGIETRAASQ